MAKKTTTTKKAKSAKAGVIDVAGIDASDGTLFVIVTKS